MCKIFNLWLRGRTFKHEILLFEYTTPYAWGGGGYSQLIQEKKCIHL